MDPFPDKTSSAPSSANPAGLRILIRSASSAAGTGSRQPSQPAIRVTRNRKVEHILPDAKLHVITQFRQAQQASRIASLAQRVGKVVPNVEKNTPGDARRVTEISRHRHD
jgi:predicted transcriptional regulator